MRLLYPIAGCLLLILSVSTVFAEERVNPYLEEEPPECMWCAKKYMREDAVLTYDLNNLALYIDDKVTDGCFPRPKSLETAAKAALIRNGFQIKTATLFEVTLLVDAFGYAIGGGCAVSLAVKLRLPVAIRVAYSSRLLRTHHEIVINHSLLVGSKSNMQKRMQDSVMKAIDQLLVDVTNAKKQMETEYPELVEEIRDEKAYTEKESEKLR